MHSRAALKAALRVGVVFEVLVVAPEAESRGREPGARPSFELLQGRISLLNCSRERGWDGEGQRKGWGRKAGGEETHAKRRLRTLRDLARERPALCKRRAHIHHLRHKGVRLRQSQRNPHRLWGQPCQSHVGCARGPATRLRARFLQPLD